MRNAKKILSLALAVMMIFSLMQPAFATEPAAPSITTSSASYLLGGESDTVDVEVYIANNPGITSANLNVYYNTNVFTLTKVTDGGVLGGAQHSNNLALDPYPLTWGDDLATENNTANGKIVTLTFEVADNAPIGVYDVVVEVNEPAGGCYDKDMQPVEFTTSGGTVSVDVKQAFTVSDADFYKGSETVDVEIAISDNPGITSANLNVYYDTNVFTLTKVADGGVLGGAQHSNNLTLNPFPLTWGDDLATENNTANGKIVTLTFAVYENAEVGEYEIGLKVNEMAGGCYDKDMIPVPFKVEAGTVTIANLPPMPGNEDIAIADAEFTYDGTAKSIEITGKPADASVSYTINGEEGNSATAVGQYEVVATISQEGYSNVVKKATLDIKPIEISVIEITTETKVYDGTTAANVTFEELYPLTGDEVELAFDGEFNFASKDVGKNIEVVYDGEFYLAGEDAGNYVLTVTKPAIRGEITPATLEVSTSDLEMTVGGEVPEISATFVGFVGEETDELVTGEFALPLEADGREVGVFDIDLGTISAGANYEIAYTAGTLTVKPLAEGTAYVKASNATFAKGSESLEVEVEISIDGNPGITSANLNVDYNGDVMALTKVEDAGVLGGAQHSNNLELNPFPLTWGDDLATENNTANGKIVTLTFTVDENIEVGSYPIDVTVNTVAGGVYDKDMLPVEFTAVGGRIAVVDKELEGVESIVFNDAEFAYDGTEKSIVLTGAPEGTKTTYKINGAAGNAASDAGTYTVVATVSKPGFKSWVGEATLTITPASVSVSGVTATKEYDGTDAAILSGGSLTGVFGEDVVTLGFPKNATYASVNVGSDIAVTLTDGIKLEGADAGNYVLANATPAVSGSITAKAVEVTSINLKEKTAVIDGIIAADAEKLALDIEKIVVSKQDYEALTAVASNFILTGDAAANYTVATEEVVVAITKVTAEVPAEDATISADVVEETGSVVVSDITPAAPEVEEVVIDVTNIPSSEDPEVAQNIGTVSIPKTVVEAVSNQATITIEFPAATVAFDDASLDAILAAAEAADITITVKEAEDHELEAEQLEAIDGFDNRTVVTLEVTSNGEVISSDFLGGVVGVEIEFILSSDYDEDNTYVKLAHVEIDGSLTPISSSYDFDTGLLTAYLPHFSDYVIYTEEKRTGGANGGLSAGGTGSDKQSFTVSFDSKGGSAVNSVKVYEGGKVAVPTSPIKAGYVFAGWFTDPACTIKYDFSSKVSESFTLYANWTEAAVDTGLPFVDVKADDWFFDAVKYAYENKLFGGVSDTQFAPNSKLTRAMLVTVLYRAEGEPEASADAAFADVAAGAYYADAVAWAKANGVVNGVSETAFAPDNSITREQLAVILYRYAQLKGEDVSVGEDTNILSFADAESVSDYAVEAMQWACGAGIITGKGANLDPLGSATRAEVATMLQRYLSK